MNNLALTSRQIEHVAGVSPGWREEMSEYLREQVEVGICVQREDDAIPPYAIYVLKRQDFWIDCCDTYEQAVDEVRALGLRLSA